MDMIPVDSEAVSAIGYDGANLHLTWRSTGKTSENGCAEFADISPVSSNQSTPGVGYLDYGAGCLVSERIDWEISRRTRSITAPFGALYLTALSKMLAMA